MLTLSQFGPLDWVVVVGYLAVLFVAGAWFSRKEQKTTREYFLAERRMPMWAVAVSILATSLSAATFIGAPQLSYAGNLTYISSNIGGLIAVFVVAIFFIPVFYKYNCTTIYELLERRFGPGAKHAASAAFMVGRVFASGARIYIAAIPLSMIMFGPEARDEPTYLIGAILALTFVAILCTLIGGIASVIWTDCIQTAVLLIAVVAVISVLLARIDAPLGQIVETLSTAGPAGSSKLTVVDPGLRLGAPGLGFDPGASFTLLTAVLGISLLNIAAFGTDHDMTQRMLTCKSAAQGSRSVLVSLAIAVPVVMLFMVIGLLLFIFYTKPELVGADFPTYTPNTSDRVFLQFILRELPAGLSGLMIAGLFAVGIGSLNSAINAMAATFIRDFYMHFRTGRSEAHYLSLSRWVTVGWGAVLAGFAIVCVYWQRSADGQSLIDLALSVMTFCYAGLLAVFATALFTKRGNTASAIAAIITGFLVVLLLQPQIWPLWTANLGLPTNVVDVKLAWPWFMTIAAPVAFLVCVSGSPRRSVDRAEHRVAATGSADPALSARTDDRPDKRRGK
jgi:solute:Na+ symporter, SSS family